MILCALDGVFDLGLPAILDAFQTANELIEMTGLEVPQFEVKIVGNAKGGPNRTWPEGSNSAGWKTSA